MYESLREHFDVVLAIMIASVIAIHAMIRSRFVAMEKKLKTHDERLTDLEASDEAGFENVLSEIRVMRAEVTAEVSKLRAWIAENYKRRGENGHGFDDGRGEQ